MSVPEVRDAAAHGRPEESEEAKGRRRKRAVDAAAARRDVVGERTWTLRRRLGTAFGSVAGLLAVLVAGVVVSAALFASAGNDVIYTWQPAVSVNTRVLLDAVDQETGLRGYALTRDPAYLEPYESNSLAQKTDSARLAQLVGGDAQLGPMLDRINRDIGDWRTRIAAPAIAAIRAGDADGVRIVAGATAKTLFDRIRADSATLRAELITRTLDARDNRTVDGTVFAVALSLLALVVIASGIVLWRGLHRWVLGPVDHLGAQTREVAGGDTHLAIVAGGPAELTMLGHDVEAMRLQIAGELERVGALVAELESRTAELEIRSAELARSNDDLQQFAYVASHDLSEPLRKVANFCQLLERQYGPQLDDRARQYIDFAVDGAKRMQVLISDLLALSRVGRTTDNFVAVDLDAALDQAIANLGSKITSVDAEVHRETALPTVMGDRSLLTSLLENLVGNAVKYRRPDVVPTVRIGAAQRDGVWEITVADNGIGIDSQYAERIFVVFQRLHLRDQYGGTGIGLALCRRIVEFHGGRIRLVDRAAEDGSGTAVESAPGATFRFTLNEGGRGAQPRD